MLISAICPVFNGAQYISNNILQFFSNSKPNDKELIIVDGGSIDGTIQIVQNWVKRFPNVKLLNNPHRYVPHSLNIGIKEAKGEFISRLDVHTEYPFDYFEKCIELINSTNADNVGGCLISCGVSKQGVAIANCMSSIFGVGNSIPRIQICDGFVDSVAFGFWKKEVFQKYGMFNESLIKNQDEEHNFRILESGGTIFQTSNILTKYYVRENIVGLIKQMYNYGYYKPQVLIGRISRIRTRQFIPAIFIIYLLISLLVQKTIIFIPLYIYLLGNVFYSFNNRESLMVKSISFLAYPCMHISYGIGFILGFGNLGKQKT